jgi:hypothetical protein
MRIASPQHHFSQSGFVRMAPPLRLPGRGGDRDWTDVWLRLPATGQLDVSPDQHGRPKLTYPVGTAADRVEFFAHGDGAARVWSIADVRGTELVQGDELFHALRPETREPHAPLSGYAWRRSDPVAAAAATDRLAAQVAELARVPETASVVVRARSNNECANCHQHAREENTQPHQYGLVNRGTDHAGFFVVETVLSGRAPVERYLPEERNTKDDLVRFVCPAGGAVSPAQRDASDLPICPDDRVPIGVFDIARGLEREDKRARDVCSARRYLYEHMTERARNHYADGFAACGIPG